jgi:hypothetical protein
MENVEQLKLSPIAGLNLAKLLWKIGKDVPSLDLHIYHDTAIVFRSMSNRKRSFGEKTCIKRFTTVS